MSAQEILMKPLKHVFDYSEYIKNPNLPDKKVSLVAINSAAGEAIKNLTEMGIECLPVDVDSRLPMPINSHADIQLLHMGKNTVFCHKEHLFTGEFKMFFNIKEINSICSNEYPNDVFLNCTLIGDKLICNPKTVATEIIDYAANNGLTVIPVNQGYARCSVCVINDNTLITDDESIFRAAGNFLNDVLFISKGSIGLKGYNYGFIGGCCGKIDKNIIAFNGELKYHNDYKKICDFLNKHSIEYIELKKGKLEDIGGILPILQYKTNFI